MPRVGSSKLKVVDIKNEEVEQPVEQPETAKEETKPVEEITVSVVPVEEKPVQPTEPVIMKSKPKSKAKAKAKAKVKEEAVKEEAVKEEVKEEAVKEVKKKERAKPTVQCPKCNKWLTEKGLQYSHQCPYDKVQKSEIEKQLKEPKIIEKIVEKQIPHIIERVIEKSPRIIKEPANYDNIPEEIIQRELQKRQISQKEQRINKRMENTKRLTMNIA